MSNFGSTEFYQSKLETNEQHLLSKDDGLLDSVDGEPGDGVVGGVGLHLAHGPQAAVVGVDVHVVEGGVNNVNAKMKRNQKNCRGLLWHFILCYNMSDMPFLCFQAPSPMLLQ